MSVSHFMHKLNGPQKEAVSHVKGPLLVLAGAGSGKTRILTFRMAHLIESGAAFPGEILAVTFTNKAAREMSERVHQLVAPLGVETRSLWISTFHSAGAKLLRLYGERLGLKNGFTIFDQSDQLTLVKNCMKDLGINDKVIHPNAVLARINQLKNEAIGPRDFEPARWNFTDQKIIELYPYYEEQLEKNNAVDFGDLLYKLYLLFKQDQELREQFQDRYPYILVDEYQDTNHVQYLWLKLISEKHRNLCVVGDEDQSIYKWRGADIRNILEFKKDFPEAHLVKLEENYRSSASIIRAASKVISNNSERNEKTLYTNNPVGHPVEVHVLESDQEEARFIVRKIKQKIEAGAHPRDFAIFYRTNAQSRLFEEHLRYYGLHYKIFGGMKFYERAEIKDAISYLRVLCNPMDDVSLYRIINTPARGLGGTTLDKMRDFSRQEGISGLEAAGRLAAGEGDLGSAGRRKLQEFLSLYHKLISKMNAMGMEEFYAYMLEESAYMPALKNENTIEAQSRIENLKELASALEEYESEHEEASFQSFLEEITLVENESEAESNEYVTLMTLHSSKGLEFPFVYIGGLEEDLFPSNREGEANIEEERRLCYVGMTRAMKELTLSSAKVRRVFGTKQLRSPSRFLDELPKDEIKFLDHAPDIYRQSSSFGAASFEDDFASWDHSSRAGKKRPQEEREFSSDLSSKNPKSFFFSDASGGDSFGGAFEESLNPQGLPASRFKSGVKVKHPDYGIGVIESKEGSADATKVKVRFPRFGSKKFVLKFAPLEIVSG